MKTKTFATCAAATVLLVSALARAAAASDPQLSSWYLGAEGSYARVYTTDTARTNGQSVTTWSNGAESQSVPSYCGIEDIYSSSNWIYLKTSGLGTYVMGPWYNDASRTTIFLNYPTNQHQLYAIPRTATVSIPAVKSSTSTGGRDVIGYFVDGVAMFDALDGFVWNGTTEVQGGMGQWHRAAYVNEIVTMDPSNSHQQNTGIYHNHANPIALRYTLGDHVNFDPATKLYSEATNAPSQHSPLLGWVCDGLPIYGPYGYSNPTNPASGVRRMVSGFVLRDGQNGTDNLTTSGRSTLPAWMLRNNGNIAQSGPAVSVTYPLGRYLQDYSYLGDLTNSATGTNYQLGVDFDLNEYNVRYCVTPEFPNGTWAYFVCINSNGTPIAPYNVGRYFFGSPTGGKLTTLAEAVTTNYVGGAGRALELSSPVKTGQTVTLAWSAVEGGTYQVESSTNLSDWEVAATNIAPSKNVGGFSDSSSSAGKKFYRVLRTSLAVYDAGTNQASSGGGVITMSPASGARGTTITITATLSSSASPPLPPSGAPVQSFVVGTLTVSGAAYTTSSGQGVVTGSLTIPAGAATGQQTVTISFQPPPGQQQGPSYSQANAFTIQ
ncbi:MAG TPA: YHYH protein [Verrucomicrobiae bacterium]|nr:YHYH protein [Verrucomicrobiae bacterium]